MKKDNVMDNLLEMVCDKLEIISKAGELNATLASELDTLIDIKKDILEVMAMEEYTNNQGMMQENGYSQASGNRMNMNSYDGGMNGGSNGSGYSSNNSYGHGRGYVIQPYYQNDYGYGQNSWNSYGRMNMANGYSRTDSETDMMNKLRDMAQNASPEKRDVIHQFIGEMERM